MVQSIRNLGRPGVSSMAIAAVDVALWDLKARLLGLPLVTSARRDPRSCARLRQRRLYVLLDQSNCKSNLPAGPPKVFRA